MKQRKSFYQNFTIPQFQFILFGFVLLAGTATYAQVLNPIQAGVIEGGYGTTPNLTGATSVFVQGNFAYVVGTGDVLEILDITLPGQPLHKGSLANGTGGASILRPAAVVVKGNFAYITSFGANALEIVDVSNPSQPIHKGVIYDGNGQAPYLNAARGLAISGNYAYVSSEGSNALEIIDVSNPALPVHKGSILDGGGSAPFLSIPTSVYVLGNYAYVGVIGALEIVDISNPAAPKHAGSIQDGGGVAPFLKRVYSVCVSGNFAYLTDWSNRALEIIDVSNATNPIHKGSLIDGAGAQLPFPISVSVNGNQACIVSAGGALAFEIVDVSNPALPKHLGSITNLPILNVPSVFVVNNLAYVTSQKNNSLSLIDITDPTSPVVKSTSVTGTDGAQINVPISVFVSGNYAYIASFIGNALEIVDVSNPSQPVHKGSLQNGSGGASLQYPSSVYVSGNYAYVVDNAALEIVNVTNPSIPLHEGSLVLGTIPASIFVSGNYAYVVGGDGTGPTSVNEILVVDVSIPASPKLVGSLMDGLGVAPFLNNPISVYVSGNYAYIASYNSNALEIVDVTDPAHPKHHGSLMDGVGGALLKNPAAVYVSGDYAFVGSDGSNALEIVNVTNPGSPMHQGSLTDGMDGVHLDNPASVYVSGNYAYVANPSNYVYNAALEIIDITDLGKPVHYKSMTNGTDGALLDEPSSVFVSGNYAYVTNAGLFQDLDIVNLYGPSINSFSPAGGPVGTVVTITGQNFNTFFAASVNGKAADISSVSATTLTFTIPSGASVGKIVLAYNGQSITSGSNFIVTPTALSATAVGQTGFTANWSDVGATSYYLDVSTDNFTTYLAGYNNLSVGNVTTYAVSGLTPGASYQYRVRSSDGILTSGSSVSASAFLIADTPTSSAATAVSQTGFTANWSLAAGATGYAIDVAYDNAFSNFVVGYNNLTVANASATSQLVNGLNPYTTCYFRVRATSASGSSASSNAVAVVTLDIIPPVISPAGTPNPATVTFGNTPIINAIIVDNVSIDTAQLFYRGISEKIFQKVNLQGPGGTGGSYSVTMQSTWYDTQGLEYYFRAVDEVGNTTVSTSSYVQLVTPSIALPALPSGTKQSDYRIVSFPYLLATDNKVTTVYSGVPWSDNTKAAMWWWNPASQNSLGKYDQYGSPNSFQTVDPGKGYWVITNTSVTPQLANVPAPNYNRSKLYSMTLKPNWNEVGNPYPVPISWDDVIAFNQKNNVTSFSSLTIYDGTSYKTATGELLLKPFEGGFVKNLSSSDITIQIPFSGETSIGGRAEALGSDISQEAWNVFLHVSQEDFTNELGGFGMHPSAKPGPDRYDNFNPPQFMESPEVNFKNPDYPNALFSKDMVPSQGNYHWRFTPNGKHDVLMQLKWSEDLKTNASKPLFLLDEQTFEIIDMTQVNDYQFTFNKGSRFSIFYGVDIGQIALPEVAAGAPYPNPLSSEAAINLNLPDSRTTYQVVLQIFNNKGELLGSTENILLPGIQLLRFGMGDQVPSGMYFYKLNVRAENVAVSFTGKIIKL